ncbi:MAG TPA: peptidyl-tRNA hydrolase Pth2 [Thermoplasmata archaeon]|nr:peptidyl-tRNA hydrolase Pth2 [Thermoplasmata archaeon]
MRNRSPPSDAAYKMVFVVRGELRLTPGKAAVQVAHAAVMLVLQFQKRRGDALERWLQEGQKKIAVVAPTLAEMVERQARASRQGIPTVWVDDAGFTEVAPGTRTCLGLGPAPSLELDKITGDLALL